MTRLTALPCIGCGAPVKRAGTWAHCPACYALVLAWLEREVGLRDPNAWVRANNVVFANRRAFAAVLALVRAERSALGATG